MGPVARVSVASPGPTSRRRFDEVFCLRDEFNRKRIGLGSEQEFLVGVLVAVEFTG